MRYEFEKYIANIDNVMNILNEYGVAIVPSVLNERECKKMNSGMWDTLETLTQNWEIKIERNNPNSWREMRKLYPKHSMLLQNWSIGQAQYVWDVRQNQKVVNVFSNIWGCNAEDLIVSFDGVSYHMPPEITKLGWYRNKDWFHCDQSYTDSNFKCVQGWVTGYDINEGDATLSILEGSHKFHEECKNVFDITEKQDWYKLNDDEKRFYIEDNGCNVNRIKCPRGSLVLWDSRTIHCGTEALKNRKKENYRAVIYVCYLPRKLCDSKNIIKKQKAFNELRTTNHYPCKIKLFPKTPNTYGKQIPEIVPIKKPILNQLGKKLAGF